MKIENNFAEIMVRLHLAREILIRGGGGPPSYINFLSKRRNRPR